MLKSLCDAELMIGPGSSIDESVRVGNGVQIGRRVTIGANTVLYPNTVIEDGCFVGANCVIGEPSMGFYTTPNHVFQPTRLRNDSIIRAGSVLYEDVEVGSEFQSGNKVCIREKTRIGDRVSLGSDCDVQPDVVIGDYTRIHSACHITEGSRIGKYVWILGGFFCTNDNMFPLFRHSQPPIIGDFCVLAARCFLYPGVKLGKHVVVAADSSVKGEHPDFSLLAGRPARRRCDARDFFIKVGENTVYPYPWPLHVARNYPWKDIPPDRIRLEDY